jgi:flagellar biosynthesis/type III secretory pathway protein FliH
MRGDFSFWLENLDTQTLTDELKREIIEYAEDLIEEAHAEGYQQAKEDALEKISSL